MTRYTFATRQLSETEADKTLSNLSLSGEDRVSQRFRSRIVYELFSRIRENYLLKARGLFDSEGERWKPLAPSTIAQKQKSRRSYSSLLLTPKEQQIWNAAYKSSLRSMATNPVFTRAEREANARADAWKKIRNPNHASTTVPIGIETQTLLNSVSPGTLHEENYSPSNEQHVKITPYEIEIGTNVSYAPYFHAKRPLFTKRSVRKWVIDAVQIATINLASNIQGGSK